MEKSKLNNLLISPEATLKTALKKIDEGGEKCLFVTNESNNLLGVITDGDIRRWILSTNDFSGTVSSFYNNKPLFLYEGYTLENAKEIMVKNKIEVIPVVDNNLRINNVLSWNNLFDIPKKSKKQLKNVAVVIMAGGKGTRLEPFTKILPKPLIPIGDKPILEIIIDKISEYGINDFFISLNYKSRIIKAYLEEADLNVNIEYIYETKPLGTIGSVKQLEGNINSTILLTNCDIIIDSNLAEMMSFHKANNFKITIIASLKHYNIPYGICEVSEDAKLIKMTEKPEYSFLVNTGMYLIEPELLNLIPEGEFFNATDLIQKAKYGGHPVGVFPIGEESWLDTGEWEEYNKTLQKIKL